MAIISRNDILNKKVLSVDGDFIGSVRDLGVDTRPGSMNVSVLVLEGTAAAPTRTVPWRRVRTVGRDAVMVEGAATSAAAGPAAAGDAPLRPESGLIDKPLLREDGQSVGRVSGFRFDTASGALVSLEAASGGFGGWLAQLSPSRWAREIPIGEIKNVGADAVVLASSAGGTIPASPAAT